MSKQMMLSSDEAAEILGVSAVYVRRLCASKRINAVKVGNQWIVMDFNGYERTK